MDPLLDAIVRSRRYDLLRQPSEVEAMGAGNVGGFQRMNDPLVDEQRFAAPSPREARANVRATVQDEMLAPAKTYGSKFLQWLAKAMIGSKGDIPPLDQTPEEFQESARNIASGFGPGILAGEKGALNIGGQVLKKFRTGEAVKDAFPSQELWRSYGYGRGAEGKGRFEISDVPAKLRSGAQEATTVGGALEHPELFKAYPQLASLPLRLRIDTLMSQGSFGPKGVMAQGYGEKEALSNLLHELQHGVQKEEGFATGANMREGREAYERSAGEQEAYNVQARLKSPDLMRFAPEGTETLPREMQLIKQDPQAVMEVVDPRVKMDSEKGLGAVPYNRDVNYFGFVKEMTPSEFFKYADERSVDSKQVKGLVDRLKEGKAFGQPFLQPEWNPATKKWEVSPSSHEGRHRMAAIRELYGDVKVPVHVFPRGIKGGSELRARHLTPEMLEAPFEEGR